MKLHLNQSRPRVAGFTLVEIYVVSALFGLLVVAMVATQFFAARVYTLAATKLTATASARKAMNDMRDAIRSATGLQVGIYDPVANQFTLIPGGSPLVGNALAIYPNIPTNNVGNNYTNFGTVYFMNPAASNLCTVTISNGFEWTSTLATNVIVWITNYYVFDAEDSKTNVLTSYTANRVIHIKLQFSQWEFPLAGVVGANAMYDYYQLQTRASMRLPTY
jgi:type II secretory pathway pseudopilin PulG